MQASPVVSSQSPSFTRANLSEIAARVVQEFIADNNETDSEFSFNKNDIIENQVNGDDDFEFAFVTEGSDKFSPISADEIFYNGQIRPLFKEVEIKCCCESDKVSNESKSIGVSLKKLFIEDRKVASEDDDLEGITPGTYCVWRPRSVEESPAELRKKSNSTGSSSKRWRLRDFLHRSNSEGKETFVFLTTPFKKRSQEKTGKNTTTDSAKITGKVAGGEDFPAVRGSINGKDNRKSYLPYRQVLVGFFGNVNGLNRNLQQF